MIVSVPTHIKHKAVSPQARQILLLAVALHLIGQTRERREFVGGVGELGLRVLNDHLTPYLGRGPILRRAELRDGVVEIRLSDFMLGMCCLAALTCSIPAAFP
jgi:hypothetical protein